MLRHPRNSTLFPYTPLSRSGAGQPAGTNRLTGAPAAEPGRRDVEPIPGQLVLPGMEPPGGAAGGQPALPGLEFEAEDRKSTRLNSSHSQISYAVFCLNKKKA